MRVERANLYAFPSFHPPFQLEGKRKKPFLPLPPLERGVDWKGLGNGLDSILQIYAESKNRVNVQFLQGEENMGEQKFKVYSAGELGAMPLPNVREDLARQLGEVAKLLDAGAPLEMLGWRLADAAADYVGLVRKAGLRGVHGVHDFSGKGGKLSVRAKP